MPILHGLCTSDISPFSSPPLMLTYISFGHFQHLFIKHGECERGGERERCASFASHHSPLYHPGKSNPPSQFAFWSITPAEAARHLGVMMDDHLSRSDQTASDTRSWHFVLYNIRQSIHLLPTYLRWGLDVPIPSPAPSS